MPDVIRKIIAARPVRGAQAIVSVGGMLDTHNNANNELAREGAAMDLADIEAKLADKFDEPTYYG